MAAPSWKGFLQDFVTGEQNTAITGISEELQIKNVTLLEIIEALGPYLTSAEKHTRCRGTQLLSELLHELPGDFLNVQEGWLLMLLKKIYSASMVAPPVGSPRNHRRYDHMTPPIQSVQIQHSTGTVTQDNQDLNFVEVLTDFYINRMKDHFTVVPHVLYGMLALSWQQLLKEESVVRIVREIFSEVHTQSLQQGVRQNVYTILENFLYNRLSAILPMGGDFVIGFVQTMDSEKDPRCLVIAFRCHQIIAQNFQIGVFAEELFEVVACYFPIDFTPPPNIPNQVSREELIIGLRSSLGAHPSFGEFCFPLLLEKITSSIPSAKLDALQTLASCVETFGTEALQEFIISLWSEIRREVFSPSNDALEGAALAALTAMVATLSTGTAEAGEASHLTTFIDDIFKDSQRHLMEPELRLIYPSARLMRAAAAGSAPACSQVVHKVIPVLLEQFHKHAQVNQRKNLIDILNMFLQVTSKVIQSKEVNPLVEHKDAFLPVLTSLLTDPSPQLRCYTIRAISSLLHSSGLISDKEQFLIAEHLTNLILADPDRSVREEAVFAAVLMARKDMTIVKDKVLTKLLQWIKEENMETDSPSGPMAESKGHHANVEFIYKAIGQVSCEPELIKTSMPQLLTRLAKLDGDPFSPEALRESQYTCRCLQTVTERGVSHPMSLEFLKSHVLPRLFVLTISGALADRDAAVVTQWDLVEMLAACVRCIVSNLNDSNELVATIVRTFMVGDLSSFNDVINNNSIGFQPLKNTSPWRQTQLLSMLSAVVSSVPRDISIPQLDLLMSRLQEVACGTSHHHSAATAAKCFSALLNKLPSDEAVSAVVGNTCHNLEEVIDCVSIDDTIRNQALMLWSWITKALVLRGHAIQTKCVNKMVESLESASLGAASAEGFQIVLREYNDVMVMSMHANIRLMYRQRFFLQTSGRLVEGFNKASKDQQVHYLTALAHILRNLPQQVLAAELPSLIPLLIQSLLCDNVGLQLSTATTMADLLSNNPQLLASHVAEIIPSLMRMTTYRPNMKVRMAGAKCLGLLTTLSPEILAPHQAFVIRELGAVVGDHKRCVRQEAVEARSQWYLLDTSKK